MRQPVARTVSAARDARLRRIASTRWGLPAPKGGVSRDSAPEELNAVTMTDGIEIKGIAMAERGMPRQEMKSSAGSPEIEDAAAQPAPRAELAGAIDRRSPDNIVFEPAKGPIDLHLGDAQPAERRQNYSAHKTEFGSGALWPYAPFVRSAVTAAAAHPGASEEIHVYADI